MSLEIERKFLVSGDYKSHAHKSIKIVQGYLSSIAERTVRIRITDHKAYLTIKGKSNETGMSRYEWEKEISTSDASDLIAICEEGVIEKQRHLVYAGKHCYEVDEFDGDNKGLVIAEIELQSENETFIRPQWLGEEVTNDSRYYNSYLVKYPYQKWK